MKIIKKFYKPFVITYVLLSIALGSYPTFDFYTFKAKQDKLKLGNKFIDCCSINIKRLDTLLNEIQI